MATKQKADEVRKILQTLRICSEDHRMALQQCEKLLLIRPDDEVVRKYKTCALIRASKFDKAISFIRTKPLSGPTRFQLAYCLYRTERYEEALKHLQHDSDDVQIEILRAQIFYRLKKFTDAAATFKQIIPKIDRKSHDELFHDILVNAFASFSEAGDLNGADDLSSQHREDVNDTDMLLNMAMTGLPESAVDRINLIHSIRSESEIIVDGSIQEDDSSLVALLSGLCILAGRREDAVRYLTALANLPNASTVLQAVSANNWICVQDTAEVFDSLRKMKQCLSNTVSAKLNDEQRMIVRYNNALLHMHMRKFHAALTIAKSLLKEFPSKHQPAVAAVYAFCKAGKAKSVEMIEQFCVENNMDQIPGFSKVLRLYLAQLRLEEANPHKDIRKVLEAFPEQDRFSVGVASSILQMQVSKDSPKDIIEYLQDAMTYWNVNGASDKATSIMGNLADYYIAEKMYKEAEETLRKLFESRKDEETIRKLVHTLSFVDADAAYALGAENDCFMAEDDSYDMEELIAEELPRVKQTTFTDVSTAPKKTRRKSKKNKQAMQNTENEIDPERWIPMRDRQSLKKFGKKTLARMLDERRQYAAKKRAEHAERVAQANAPPNAEPTNS